MNEPLAPIPEAVPDELPGTVAGCHKLISDLLKGQFALQSRLNELEERLKLNSRNSSKPPSGDGAGGTSGRNKPRSRRKRGGQPGHKGSYRAAIEEDQLDRIIDCAAPTVCDCGGTMLPHGRALPIKSSKCSGCGSVWAQSHRRMERWPMYWRR
jgi:transposase